MTDIDDLIYPHFEYVISFFCVLLSYIYIYHIGFKVKRKKVTFNKILIFSLLFFQCLVSFTVLMRGGIFYPFDKKNEQYDIYGTIESIYNFSIGDFHCNLPENDFYRLGDILLINGKEYNIVSHNQYFVGDNVHIKVLPLSRFVVYIEYIIEE